jgi:protein CpxP
MNADKSKLLWVAVIALLVLNFSTLAFIWFRHPPDHHEHEMHGGNVADFLIHELSFSDEQVKKFDELKKDHHERVENIQHALHDLHDDFFNLMKADVIDSSKVNSVADAMALKQKEIETVTFNHFSEVRKLCDADQKKKFDKVIDEAMRMMAPRPPGPPRR